jgi:aminoglycoside/choline kinase family phosphotransferase
MKRDISVGEFHVLLEKLGKTPVGVKPLPLSGSARRYFRFFFEDGSSLIGSFNPDTKENKAHYVFTKHFRSLGLLVPDIIIKDDTSRYFILEDLGDNTLLKIRETEGLQAVRKFYEQALEDLVRFQTEGVKGLDLSVAYPAKEFDKRSVMWDLNYFKYFFIKTNEITFDESLLEDDFELFAGSLLDAESDFFMYRDFQARNIMVKADELWYIDFQGGRKGPLQYDVISLLYQARADLPEDFRAGLLQHYLKVLENRFPGQREKFMKDYPLFIYFRLMQVLGAYGFRGLFQRKAHFLQSIPFTIENLKKVMSIYPLPDRFKELRSVFDQIMELKDYDFARLAGEKLNITITSFSYKKTGVPVDVTENGGGFVFDCRALPNPGRLDDLKMFTGLEKPVIDYLSGKKEVSDFLDHVFSLVDQSVDNYLERGFEHLMVNFGCTGGHHRSVYSAENLKRHLEVKYGEMLQIHLKHIELEKEGEIR